MYAHPPYYNAPVRYKKRSGGGSCCRCICCCCCFLFFLVLLSISITFFLYHFYDPKLPIYEVSDLRVKALDMNPKSSIVKTEIELSVKAENPNKRIGFVYGENNTIEVSFMDVVISGGKVAGFRQGPENTTVVKINLRGNATFDANTKRAFEYSRKMHQIPLAVKIKVPVNLAVGEVLLREIKAFVDCDLVIDDVSPKTSPKILSKNTNAHFEF